MKDLAFFLDVRRPEERRIEVRLQFDRPSGTSEPAIVLSLPNWTPGSYMIRDYARHLGPVRCHDLDTGRPLSVRKVRKNRFAIATDPTVRRLEVSYSVYAHELTVRTSDLTADHAFWNHACVLLWPLGVTDASASIAVQLPKGWDIASSLPRLEERGDTVVLQASSLDVAMDAPCLAGKFVRTDWRVRGIPHSLVLDGLGSVRPPASLIDDLTAVVECAADVFGGTLPYERYLFLCLFSEQGHGGLEHTDSTTLLSARAAMRPGKAYQQFLGLAAHEFFHVWNVKRMRPAELWTYDYEVENYTPNLWLAEGFTAYYDDLICLRAGLLTVEDYLALLAKNLGTVLGTPGRFQQTLSESSYDAWIRLYQPNENTRNATQNYYGHGAVAALCLDLTIRRATAGRHCLDDAVRDLYESTFGNGRGYTREDIVASLSRAAGSDMAPLLASLVDEWLDPRLADLLAAVGLALVFEDRNKPYLGISFDEDSLVVTFVVHDGPGHRGGIAPGDEVLAVDNVRVRSENWGEVFPAVASIGRPVRMLVASRGLVSERVVVPSEAPFGTCRLELVANPSEQALSLRNAWLRQVRKPQVPATAPTK